MPLAFHVVMIVLLTCCSLGVLAGVLAQRPRTVILVEVGLTLAAVAGYAALVHLSS